MPPRSNVDPSEAGLVSRAAAGDRAAREELFVRHRSAALAVARRITGRDEDAADVVQESFIKAFESLAGFQRDSVFRTWLLRIVSNRSLDLLRSRRVRQAAPLAAGDENQAAAEPAFGGDVRLGLEPRGVAAAIEQSELRERLDAALDRLPPEQRSAFALFALGELTYGQIAEVLDIPIGTVMSRLYHARQKLQALLVDLDATPARRSEKAKRDSVE